MEKSWGFPMPLSELLPASARRKHGPLKLPPMAANCSSDLSPLAHEQEFMELLWENGQIVLQGQTQRAAKRSLERESAICNPELDLLPPWPNYEDFSLDFLPEIPATVPAHSLSSDPPCDAPRGPDDPPFYGSDVPNFAHFLRASSAAASSGLAELESTLDPGSSTAEEIPARQSSPRPNKKKAHEDAADESSAAEEIPAHQSSPRPNKKKAHEDGADEDVEGESKKPSAKRSRATEVHNQSERRRRDRINEKLKALQELIPNCSKVDKASVLDEAIEYLKTLQMQLQIMSMGGGIYMSPMMISPRMPMGMPMGMAFGMGMIDPNGYPLVLPPPPPLDHPSATIPPPGHGPKYKPPPVPIPRPPPKKVNSPAKTSKNS